jgi:hypothetical protein
LLRRDQPNEVTSRTRRGGHAAVLLAVVALAACGGEGAGSDTAPSATDSLTPTGEPLEGAAGCWQAVGEAYEDASDQGVLILRDGVARLLREHRAFTRALNAGEVDKARQALDRFIEEAQSVTNASAEFDRVRRMAIAEQSKCEGEAQGENAVAAWGRDVAAAYGAAASQADRALDKPMAIVLFGLQEIVAAGNRGNVEGVYRANRTVTKGLERLIPQAGCFARLAGAASAEDERCAE